MSNQGSPGDRRRGDGVRALGWIVAGVLSATAAICGLCVVVVLMLLAGKQLADEQNACAAGVDPAVLPIGAPGSLGGMYGTGITRAEYQTVTQAAHGDHRFTEGVVRATQYGPPWGGIEGDGIATSAGLRINGGAPHKYFIAVDPAQISYGQWVYVWPNQFQWPGPFLAADTGGAIRGQHIDVYDWRGSFTTLEQVRVSRTPIAPDTDGQAAPAVAAVDDRGLQQVTAATPGSPVGAALVDASGQLVASVHPDTVNRSASVTKALILIAVTRLAADRDLTATEQTDVRAMIRDSDNQAANRLYSQTGRDRVLAAARAAGMTRFEVIERKQHPDGFILGYSHVTAGDLARLFAHIDQLLAPRHRALGLTELEHIQGAGRFGIYDTPTPGTVRTKSGWRQEGNGTWTINQAAQITIDGRTYGLAVVLGHQPSFAAGAAAIRSIAAALAVTARGATTGAAGGCGQALPDVSGVGQRIAQIATRHLGQSGRTQAFAGFTPPRFNEAWCAWFATNVWRLAGVAIPLSAWSGAPYDWAQPRGLLFKSLHAPPHGITPPLGSALMYGTGPQAGASDHVNLVTTVNPDGSFMLIGGNQGAYPGHVTQEGPCRLTHTDPARLTGPGCDSRPIYAIATPTTTAAA